MIRARQRRLRVVLAGTIAATPHQGGAAWAVLQYALGLRQLGCEVYLIEPIDACSILPDGAPLDRSENARYFRQVMQRFGLEQKSALLLNNSHKSVGLTYEELRRVTQSADLLINISGMLHDDPLTARIPVRAYLDLDPTFVQLWQAQGVDMRFEGHTHFVTIGQHIGEPTCDVPTCEIDWIKTLQPVLLSHWATCDVPPEECLTTVGNWRSYGSITRAGSFYGQKAHSIREILSLPQRVSVPIRLAMGLHPSDQHDICQLAQHRWQLVDPLEVTSTPDLYQKFVARSWAELGVAKAGYVKSACGWFSDRSLCYLASGRPVIAQETGFGRYLPTGEGLFSFSTIEDVLAGVDALRCDYRRHARCARLLAEEFFDSRIVLTRLLDQLGLSA